MSGAGFPGSGRREQCAPRCRRWSDHLTARSPHSLPPETSTPMTQPIPFERPVAGAGEQARRTGAEPAARTAAARPDRSPDAGLPRAAPR